MRVREHQSAKGTSLDRLSGSGSEPFGQISKVAGRLGMSNVSSGSWLLQNVVALAISDWWRDAAAIFWNSA